MFGSNKNESPKSKGSAIIPSVTNHSLNSLVSGTVINGAVNSDSDIRIDGKIEGKLHCKAKVIIGPTGFVQGEIRCENAVIEGKFDGHLYVNDLLNIRESASIKGEVQTNKLIVQSGAAFNVSCQMGKTQAGANNGAATESGAGAGSKENKDSIKATKVSSAT